MTWLARLFGFGAQRPEAAPAAASTAAAPAPAPDHIADAGKMVSIPVHAAGHPPHPGGTLGPLADALAAPMVIQDHRLAGAAFDASPHVGGIIVPRFIIMHYTAGGTAANSVGAIARRGLSAHFFVDRDGSIIQTVACNREAYHAGESAWQGYHNLNAHSIGIEVANLGWFDRQEAGGWTRDGFSRVMPPSLLVVARHKWGGRAMAWEVFPDAQLRALDDLTRALLAAYPTILDVAGHDEVSPGRKVDPGPAFPIARYRAMVPPR
jgi:N-acetylmuramoyl-L-alanine amidase